MKTRIFCAAILAASVGTAGAQTTRTVGATGADHTTINDALAASVEDDIIQIIDDGVYDEAISITFGITIEGTGASRPVLAVQAGPTQVPGDTGGTDGLTIVITDGGDVTLRNLIIIPSGTNTPADDLIRSGGSDGLNVLIENVVATANDGSDGPITLDGLAEESVASPVIPIGDDVAFLTGTNSNFTLRSVVFSHAQGGNQAAADALVCSGLTNNYLIEDGSVFSYCNRLGLQATGNSFVVDGTNERIKVIGNKGFAGIWYSGPQDGGRSIDGCDVIDHVNPGNAAQGWGVESQNRGTVADSTFSNMRIWGSQGQGFLIGAVGTTNTIISNVTFAGNTAATFEIASASEGDVTITDSILAGNGSGNANQVVRHNGTGTLTINNSAIVTNGPQTLIVPPTDGTGTIIQNSVIPNGPNFKSLTFTDPDFLDVQNPAYGEAATGDQPLSGGANYDPFFQTDATNWQRYQ